MKRILIAAATSLVAADALAQQSTEVFADPLEWSLPANVPGNPFDAEATATFTHADTGQTISTPMFYDGGGNYRFRFTAPKVGTWTYATSSPIAALNGQSGNVAVAPSSDPRRYGFTTNAGNQWVRQTAGGDVEAFVPQLAMLPQGLPGDVSQFSGKIDTFLNGHGFTGFHVPSVAGYWFDSNDSDNRRVQPGNDINPDPATFDNLERVIRETRAAGGHVHIWAWGDAARGQTPNNSQGGTNGLAGGPNGEVDRRLQRYIAARLGPVPGWSMGYGFDLDEWAGANDNPERQIEPWHDFVLEQSGYNHLLGGRSDGPNVGDDPNLDTTDHGSDRRYHEDLSYAGYEHWEPTYEVYRAAMESFDDKPIFSEDRFRIRNGNRVKDYTEEQTRQGLWLSTMAGGVANIWGDLAPGDDGGSGSYDNAEQLKTYSTFFFDNDRFRVGMEVDNDLTADATHYVLRDGDELIVIYAEDADEVVIDLSALDVSMNVVAVDAMQAYAEIHLGQVAPGQVTIDLPSAGNWAVALTPVPEPGISAVIVGSAAMLLPRRARR
jgi:hypothetical protein